MGRAGARWAASGREGKEGSAACSALWAEKKGMGRGKEKGRLGWNERRGRRGLKFSFFSDSFSNSFSNFANFTQTIKPCSRIIMHKHLLFLTLLQ
jgi:hypothetical protein